MSLSRVRVDRLRRWLWPAFAGSLTSLGFAPASVPVATLAGVTMLIALLRVQARERDRLHTSLGAGLLYGLGFAVPLLWWMRVVSPGAHIALAVAQAALIAVSIAPIRLVMTLPAWPIWATGVWMTAEYLRGSYPFGGFPWGRLAYATLDTPMESYVRMIGMAATSGLVFLTGTGLAYMASAPGRRRAGSALVGVGIVFGVGAVLPVGASAPSGVTSLAVVQGDVPVLFAPWPRREIFDKHVVATRKLIQAIDAGEAPRPRMVLWPENSLDFDPLNDPAAGGELSDLAKALNAPILIGAILDGPSPTTAVNAGIVWTSNGPAARYTKRKLVPFGEYVPFRQSLEGLVPRFGRDIPRDMLPGAKQGTINVGDVRVGDTICWDVAHDNVVRDVVRSGAQLLVVQTSNASFTGTTQPEQQWQISRLRAIETGRAVVVPSTNGISGVIDARGKVVARLPTQKATFASADVELAEGITSGVRWGAPLQGGGVLIGTFGLLWAMPRTWKTVRRHCDRS
jgi:apolipoprotein N-acyltransferase